jgi:hypothetical protein
VHSLALGEPRVAALGDDPFLFENGTFRKVALPAKLRPAAGQRDEGRIFFGRDDRMRIMGIRFRETGREQLYLRHRDGEWKIERNEIAKLRDPPPEGMWGVLGHADPEVVCKIGDECIIKRRTGWKMIPAGKTSPRVELHAGVAYALREDGVERLEGDKRWVPLGAPAPFKGPGGVSPIGDELWVSEPATGTLFHLRDGKWASEPSPVGAPHGLFAASRTDVWLAGDAGLAHYDGATWSRVAGPTGPLAEVQGREGEVWAAGQTGVWVRHK